MKRKLRALFALLLIFCLCATMALPAAAQESTTVIQTANAAQNSTKYGNSLRELIRQQFTKGVGEYEPDDIVTVIVQLDAPALLDTVNGPSLLAGEGISAMNIQHLSEAQAVVQEMQQDVAAQICTMDEEVSVENSESFTLLLNAFTIQAPYRTIGSIRALNGVKSAVIDGSFSIPETQPGYELYTDHSAEMIGLGTEALEGLTGTETLIAILDTGIEYSHEAFAQTPENMRYTRDEMTEFITGVADQLQAKINIGQDIYTYETLYDNVSVESLILSDKIIYSFDYADADYDATADNSDHGIHVAGITAGHTVDDAGDTTFSGVAPDAQLAVMKVFNSSSGQCSTTTLLAALEDCVLLNVDVINMSLGTPSGFAEDESPLFSEVLDKIEAAGIILAVSAGNDTDTAATNPLNSTGLAQVSNPDHGIVSSPSTYQAALSVASVNNSKQAQHYLLLADQRMLYTDPGEGFGAITSIDDLEVAAIPGVGTAADYEGIDVTGKAALVKRGEITLSDKVAYAWQAGALAVIIYNNEDSDQLINMQIDSPHIPSAFISKADGETAVAKLDAGERVILSASEDYIQYVSYPEAEQMSSFSSWGPGSTLTIKPEITAPGGNIYSSIDGNSYESKSGTSMSCPQIAGAAALLTQYISEQYPDTSKADRAELIRALMLSTADPVELASGVPAAIRQQGAGLIQLKDAVSTAAVLYSNTEGGLPKAELGSNENGTYSFSFIVQNLSDEPLSYTPGAIVLSDTVKTNDDVSYFSGEMQDITANASISFNSGTVSVAANSSATVNVKIELNSDLASALMADFPDGTYIEGFITLTSNNGGESLNYPFLGYLGDWESPAMFDNTVYDGEVPLVYDCYAVAINPQGGGNYLGYNYFTQSFDGNKLYFNPSVFGEDSTYLYSGISLLRNASDVSFTVSNADTGDVLYTTDIGPSRRTYYNKSADMFLNTIDSTSLYGYNGQEFFWPEDSEKVLYTVSATHEGDSSPQYMSFPEITIDTTAPEISCEIAYNEDGGVFELTMNLTDNGNIQGVRISGIQLNAWGDGTAIELAHVTNEKITGTAPNTTVSEIIELSELQAILAEAGCLIDELYLEVVDYAWNVTELELTLSGSQFTTEDNGDDTVSITGYTGVSSSVDIPGEIDEKTVTAIDDHVFANEPINSVTIPEGIISIGESAFQGTDLTWVKVPVSVEEIGDKAFGYDESGEPISGFTMCVAAGSAAEAYAKANGFAIEYYTDYGLLYKIVENADSSKYISVIGYDGEGNKLNIPSSIQNIAVEEIGYRAFLLNETLAEVTLPSTIKRICDRAFMFTNISSIELPSGLTTIEEGAFSAMPNLTEINIPGSIESLPYMVFANCTNLSSVTLNEGLKSLGTEVFQGCISLTGIVLPQSLETIDECAFQNCTSLASINFPSGLTTLPNGCFDNTGFTSLVIPEGITTIGSAFDTCVKLESVVIPASVTALNGTFAECAKLSSVIFEERTEPISIGSHTFNYCTSLAGIKLPETCTSLGYEAFSHSGITSIEIPGACTTVGSMAFYFCSALDTIIINDGVSSIDMMAFTGCPAVSVTIPASVVSIGSNALGYIDWSNLVKGFTISGYTGTRAESYATENNITFIALDAGSDSSSGSGSDSDSGSGTTSSGPGKDTDDTNKSSNQTDLSFTDIAQDDWFYAGIVDMAGRGYIKGVTETSFAPNSPLSRAMLVTILYRMAGEPEVSGTTIFADVTSGSYYENAVIWAAAQGIVSGYNSSTFGPNDPITRQQMAAILWRYAKYMGHDTGTADADLFCFSDSSDVAYWAKDAVAWTYSIGIMTGRSETTLAPDGRTTRAEIAVMLSRLLSILASGDTK